MILAGGLTAVTEGWSVVVMDVEEVLRIAGDCVPDSPKVLSEEGAGAVDIAVVLEDERLQKVDSCVADTVMPSCSKR